MPITRTSLLLLACATAFIIGGCAGTSPPYSVRGSTPIQQKVSIDPTLRSHVTLTALSLLDTPYRYGGRQPEQGFDCSGLVAYTLNTAVDIHLPHNSAQIADLAAPINKRQLLPGDLVFFNTLNRPFSHVGIYIGEGRFINAPSSGGRVRIDSLANPYFAQRFEGGRTLFAP